MKQTQNMMLVSPMYGLNDIKNAKGIHIAHLNVRSLMNKWETFKTQFENSNIHILGISESWLSELLPSNLFTLSNDFTFLRNDRKWNENNLNLPKKGGGVGLFINSRINFCGETLANMNHSSKDIETQWITIKQPHCKQMIIGNIYRPPQGNIDRFIETLDGNLANINLDRVELFLMGDFNIDVLEKNNPNHKKLIDFFKPLGLRQLIKNPTRPSLGKESCIDLIITNADSIEMAGVIDVSLSDHLLVHCSRRQSRLPKIKCSFLGRSYRNYNKEVFQQNIRQSNWETFGNSHTVASKWDLFEGIIRENIDEMCPLKDFKTKQKKEPWITNELIELIKDKDAFTAPNTQISGAVYIKGGSKSNTFEYTTAIYTTLFSLAITLYQQPAFHFFPTLLLFLSYSVSYLSNPRSTHLYSDPYSIPG